MSKCFARELGSSPEDLVYTSRMPCSPWLIPVTLVGVVALSSSLGGKESPDDQALQLFRERIEPVLKRECFGCHSDEAKEVKGGLRLDSRSAAQRGGDSGPAVVPGKVDESLLVLALRHQGGYEMPPDKPPLDEAIIADFVRWIELGAPDPREEASGKEEAWSAEAREHWAFQPVQRPAPPPVKMATWVRNPIDRFVLAKLEERHWSPAPEAGRVELARRLYFDLHGLPPTPEEIAIFVHDPAPNAYERLVDQLLNSPRFGERWAQHWLDVVRFAETEGYEYDRHIPDAWRYRDYVIEAFNHDKPFDQFVAEQLAGDELDPGNREYLSAAVFHRLGPVRRNAGNPDIALSRNEVLTERTDIIGTAYLGLTVGCARCHNHKLEPISQRDYYRLQSYLAATEEHNVSLADPAEQVAWDATTQRIKDEMQRLKTIARLKTGDERIRLQAQIDELEDQLPAPLPTIPTTWNDHSHRTPIHVLRRGIWEQKLEPVGPRPLSILVPAAYPELPAEATHPRAELARWLTDPAHPLTARVIVNRLWQHHFGVGLVKTANDFGTHGERPSHPELLDWLATELVAANWQLKPLHRLMVTSSAYRQSGNGQAEGGGEHLASLPLSAFGSPLTSDPDNRLFWRFNRRRLSAEELRDAMLAVSGCLNLRAGGPSVMTPVDAELVQLLYKPSQWQIARQASEYHCRSIYLIAKRNLRLPFMETFDSPAMLTSCSRRESSTHAPQALELLNGSLSNELAAALAVRLRADCPQGGAALVERAFWLTLGRAPTPTEQALSQEFLNDGALEEFALALFNLNGFAYVP